MQNPIQKFRQSSIVFEKPGNLSEKLKTLASFNYRGVQYFFAETLHTFPTYQCLQKGIWDFLICLDLELFARVKKTRVLHTCFFTFLLITQDLDKIKKVPNALL